MMTFNLSEIQQQLLEASQKNQGSGVSFSGKGLKLNGEEDASMVVEEILKCEHLDYLDLEGNTLGPAAAKAISTALEKRAKNLKRALWKDMFTGRMKNEIPLALEYLGKGLCAAGTRLVELDLSDNAFGPIGVKGLAALLSSSSCYTLQELKLNNNGLGISGGKMLAQALLDCHARSLEETNKPLELKVFVAGRNRLENEGAKALAHVFDKLRSLEEVVMPQNGIYHIGIASLASALSLNPGLRILNLNDNTVGVKGAVALAKALPSFSKLERLNLGDCLLKTKGAMVITDALGEKGGHPALTELNLSFNEIKESAVNFIADAVEDKSLLTILALDGNAFGTIGREELRTLLTKSQRIESLGTLEEDATDDEESAEDTEEDDSKNEEIEENEDEEEKEIATKTPEEKKSVTVEEFLKNPTGENLLLMPGNRSLAFLEHICQNNATKNMEEFARTIMKVSTLCGSGYVDVRTQAEQLTDILYSEFFKHAISNNEIPALNNALLVNLGLIKGEDKNVEKIDWNLEGCFKALEKVCQRDYFLRQTKDTLKLFIEKPNKQNRARVVDPFEEAKISLKAVLDRLQNNT